MELKPVNVVVSIRIFKLLIVLNGIETEDNKEWHHSLQGLLIVLNGIETRLFTKETPVSLSFNRTKWNWNWTRRLSMRHASPFNRTKWNWNATAGFVCSSHNTLLIVLNGIETNLPFYMKIRSWTFNRTKWNWNSGNEIVIQRRITF